MSGKVDRMNQRLWYLKNCDLLGKLAPDQLAELERVSQIKTFEPGSPIYLPSQPADSLMLVAQGLVKICHLNLDGKVSILAFVTPGELFGELSLFDPVDRGEYAESATISTIVRIPRENVQRLMNSELEIAIGVTKLMGFRRQRVENRLRNLLFANNQQRLSHLLLDLAEQFGIVVEGGIRLGLKLSHQEIANLIGSTRETVTLLFGTMKKQGLLQTKRQDVILADVNRLASSVGRTWK
jgi:CRP/FNR family transcriptional regulator, cyclic AMP receptor protein